MLLAVFVVSCRPNEDVLRSGKETPAQVTIAAETPSFEKDLEAMRTAGFTFIYTFKRRDGKIIDAEDVRVIKQWTVDANRRVKTDYDRIVLVGSNFQLPKDNLSALYARFLVEDYPQPSVADADVNTNSSK